MEDAEIPLVCHGYRSCRGNSSKMHRFPQVEMRALPVWRHIRGDAMYYESSFLAFVEL